MASQVTAEARTPERKEGKKVLHHIELRRAKNGGHVVRHHHDYEGGPRPMMDTGEPEEHIFGKDEGGKLIQHLVKHAKIHAPGLTFGGEGKAGEGEGEAAPNTTLKKQEQEEEEEEE